MASLKVKIVDSEPAEAIGVAVPEQDVAESKATATGASVVKAVESAETIGAVVPVQDVAESKATAIGAAAVKAVEPAEAIG